MKYRPIHELWYYSLLNIPELDTIKKELLQLHVTETRRWRTNNFYTNISSKIAIVQCPTLCKYLDRVGLLQKFDRLLFSSKQTTSPYIHVDSLNPIFCQTSLNIPLIDCENSYTAFYTSSTYPRTSSNEVNYGWLHAEECSEICRVEVTQPMLVNTTILHRGIADVPTRLICGIRFNTPLTNDDVKNLGIESPFIQENYGI